MKCAIFTMAYNAEKTIARTIESVLVQTGAEWTYYLVDNGSTDGTYGICRRYAGWCGNIVVWQEKVNDVFGFTKHVQRILEERPDIEGLCTVDADDVLAPEFLRTAVPAMEKYGAELVILGTKFMDAATGKPIGGHVMPCETVVSRKNFGVMFPKIHWYLRQPWCKLYRTSVLRQHMFAQVDFVYGGDTAMVMQFLRHVDKFALMPVYGYHYFMSPTSLSFRFEKGRYLADQFLFYHPMELLEEKAGYVSEGNRIFLLDVYNHALEASLKVAIHADVAPQERLEELYHSYCNPVTEELFAAGKRYLEEDGQYRMNGPVAITIVNAAKEYTLKDIRAAAEIFARMNGQFPKMAPAGHLGWLMGNAPEVVESVALCHYQDAFDALWAQLEKGELPCCEYTLSLGQRLCGALSQEQEYVMFSKLLIEWYMENGQKERAGRELSDWLLILPDDKELLKLKERML